MRSLIKALKSLIFSNYCLICKENIYGNGYYCVNCIDSFDFVTQECCRICLFPSKDRSNISDTCMGCIQNRPLFSKISCPFYYNDNLKNLVAEFKYHSKTYLVRFFADIIYKRSLVLFLESDVICPIPLHYLRQRQRKFNQSALLADKICRLANVEHKYLADLLIRVKNNKPQMTLKAKQRAKNVRNIFEINPKYQNLLKGKKILLVDDVITTMETVNEASRMLKKCNAKLVVVVGIGRSIRK